MPKRRALSKVHDLKVGSILRGQTVYRDQENYRYPFYLEVFVIHTIYAIAWSCHGHRDQTTKKYFVRGFSKMSSTVGSKSYNFYKYYPFPRVCAGCPLPYKNHTFHKPNGWEP